MPVDAIESIPRRANAATIVTTRSTFVSPGQPDVVFVRDAAGARLELADPYPSPTASADPATRLLALWGRRSTLGAIEWAGESPERRHLAVLVWHD